MDGPGVAKATTTNWERYAGQAYLELIEGQLDEERRAKDSLERRAAGLLTVSGAFITALFGLASGAIGNGLALPPIGDLFVAEALVLLVGGGLFSLLVQIPLDYQEAKPANLGNLVADADVWQSIEWIGTRRSADALVRIIGFARAVNVRKAWSLRVAFAFEAAGIVALAISAMA